jgi:hypothetical protein
MNNYFYFHSKEKKEIISLSFSFKVFVYLKFLTMEIVDVACLVYMFFFV